MQRRKSNVIGAYWEFSFLQQVKVIRTALGRGLHSLSAFEFLHVFTMWTEKMLQRQMKRRCSVN